MNPFLSDIEAEVHSDLLSRGNLNPPRKSSLWTGENSWTYTGCEAHVEQSTCTGCGTLSFTFKGLFLVEESRNARRFTAVDPLKNSVPLSPKGLWPTVFTSRHQTRFCVECLPLNLSGD